MDEGLSDRELVNNVIKGESQAFDVLVSRYQNRIEKLVLRFVSDRALSLDITQEIFIKIYKYLPDFKHNCTFYTWAYRIAINTVKNYHRLNAKRLRAIEVDYSLAELTNNGSELKDFGSPEQILIAYELESAINQAFRQLPQDLRRSIMLREIKGMSYEDIAKKMHCPIGTVRSRIFRARHCMSESLANRK